MPPSHCLIALLKTFTTMLKGNGRVGEHLNLFLSSRKNIQSLTNESVVNYSFFIGKHYHFEVLSYSLCG